MSRRIRLGAHRDRQRWAAPRLRRGLGLVVGVATLVAWGAGVAWAWKKPNQAAPLRNPVPDCVDADGDGYGSPGDPACANGDEPDCDDGDPQVNPGAAEVCGDSIDNDCDGDVDFGLLVNDYEPPPPGQPPTGTCFVYDPPGCTWSGDPPAPPPGGCCLTSGHKVCNAALTGVECEANGSGYQVQAPEGPAGDATCFDNIDQDCDALIDHEDPDCQGPELCNGFDDDNDGSVDEGFNLGAACTVGVGVCARTGVIVCDGSGGTRCSKFPGLPSAEAPPGGASCTDGLDNDCDGATDLADTSCQAPEKCDGLDNDGDGAVDEGFANLGQPCTAGVGICAGTGTFVCKADGSGTLCNAVVDLLDASPEGPTGETCADGLDNDCDGFTDGADPGCGASDLTVTCALSPAICVDCTGWYVIGIEVLGGSAEVQLSAELQALSATGEILAVLPVQDGDIANLSARNLPDDCIVAQTVGGVHQMFAPVPLLAVRARDPVTTAESLAFCTNIAWLDVVRPDQTVVDGTDSGGGVTDVLAAIPLVRPESLEVVVNGVEVFAALGIDPGATFPGTHPGGLMAIGGDVVSVTDIVVDVAPSAGVPSSNTLRMKIEGLDCGGNEVIVDGDPVFPPNELPQWCHADDLHDCGASLVFDLTIDSPLPAEIVNAVPTPVSGEVCHGLEIVQASINGRQLDPGGGTTFTPAVGECAGGTYRFAIDTALPATNLHAEAVGLNPGLGTFDPGTNRLIASATDVEANRVHQKFVFGVGDPADFVPPSSFSRSYTGFDWRFELDGFLLNPELRATTIVDAFVFGMEEEALNAFFAAACADAEVCLKDRIRQQMCAFDTWNMDLDKDGDIDDDDEAMTEICVPGSCDPRVRVTTRGCGSPDDPLGPTFIGEFGCTVTALDGPEPDGTGGVLMVDIKLPRIRLNVHAGGHCCGGFLCGWNTDVDMDVEITYPHPGDEGCAPDSPDVCPPTLLTQMAQMTSGEVPRGCPSGQPDEDEDGEPDCCIPEQPQTVMRIEIEEDDFTAPGTPIACACEAGDTQCLNQTCCDPDEPGCLFGTLVADGPGDLPPSGLIKGEITGGDGFDISGWNIVVLGILVLVVGGLLLGPVGFGILAVIGIALIVIGITGFPSLTGFDFVVDALKETDIESFPLLIKDVAPEIPPYEQKGLEVTLETGPIRISSAGVMAPLNIGLEVTMPDPIEDTLGYLKTEAPAPLPPIDPGNTYIVFSDDLLNGIMAAATLSGALTSETCGGTIASGLCCSSAEVPTVNDLFPTYPEDCDDPDLLCCDDPEFMTTNAFTNAAIIGTCLGVRAADLDEVAATELCERYEGTGGPVVAATLTRIARATCHGVRGANCADIPCPGGTNICPLHRGLCVLVPPLNVKASDPILWCARTGISPRFLITDDPATADSVEARLHLNDLLVSAVVDRAADGYGLAELPTIPNCLLDGSDEDCALLGACLDLTFEASMRLVQGTNGPEVDFDLIGRCADDPDAVCLTDADCPGVRCLLGIPQPRPEGEKCEGGFNLKYNYDGETAEGAAESDPVADDLPGNASDAIPVQAPDNISLAGLVTFENPQIFAIKTSSEPGRCFNDLEAPCTSDVDCGGAQCILFQDYLGVRGSIVADIPPPGVCQEKCANSIDDDGNGLIDCDDPACADEEACEDP